MFGSDRSVHYRYIINSVDILIPNEDTISVPNGQIVDMFIDKDYDINTYPIIHIGLNLTPANIYTILDNKTTARFKLRIDKYAYNKNDENYKYRETSFDSIFGIYIDDNNAQLDKELYRQTKNVQGNSSDITDMYTVYDFFLFKDSDLDNGKKIVNAVLSNTNVANALTYAISTSGMSKVLMGLPNNVKIYPELFIPPMSLIKAINYINDVYGIYNQGMLLFFDTPRMYLINKRGRTSVYARDEFTDVHVFCYNSSNENTLAGGSYKDTSTHTYLINVSRSNIDMKTTSIIEDQIDSTNTISVNPETGEQIMISPDVMYRGDAVEKVLINRFNNPYIEKEYEIRKMEMDSIIETVFFGVDMDILTPNKRFIFSFEDSLVQRRVGGIYRVKSVKFTFSKEGSEFSINARGVFVKIS